MRLRHLTHRSPGHMAEQDPRHMARRYARPEKGDYRYKLITGFFILAFLLGFAGVVYHIRVRIPLSSAGSGMNHTPFSSI